MFFGRRFAAYHKGKLSGLDILVLSIINNSDGGLTGYDIIQEIASKFRGMWKTSAGTIYPLLNRIAEKDLVIVKEIMENNREKKFYYTTEKGVEELKNALNNINTSFYSLIDFVKTISKSFPMFSCFPFPEGPEHCAFISEYQEGMEDRRGLKRIIERLEAAKERLNRKLNEIDNKLDYYKARLEKLEAEAKIIEIIDDDEEFEKGF